MLEVTNQAVITVKKEERLHSFECALNSTLGEIFDVLTEMRGYVVQKMQEADKANQESPPVPQEVVKEA